MSHLHRSGSGGGGAYLGVCARCIVGIHDAAHRGHGDFKDGSVIWIIGGFRIVVSVRNGIHPEPSNFPYLIPREGHVLGECDDRIRRAVRVGNGCLCAAGHIVVRYAVKIVNVGRHSRDIASPSEQVVHIRCAQDPDFQLLARQNLCVYPELPVFSFKRICYVDAQRYCDTGNPNSLTTYTIRRLCGCVSTAFGNGSLYVVCFIAQAWCDAH